jgi:DNA-directed RNA polymerase specialized sigma24 family protein
MILAFGARHCFMTKQRCRKDCKFAAWLARIATNSCYDELGRRRRRRENVFSQLSDGEAVFLFDQKSDGEAGDEVEARLISRDLADKLLNTLDPDDRKVFVMLKSENYSVMWTLFSDERLKR